MGRITSYAQRLPSWTPLVAIVTVSTLARGTAGAFVPSPWIMADETVYAELGRSLYGGLRLELLGTELPFYSLVYPALVGLPLRLGNVGVGYALVKAVGALVMSLAAVPAYLWARTLSSRGWALTAAALTVALPGLAYSSLLMTEVAFYPALVLAAWALARALARPGRREQTVLVTAVVLTVLIRLQALVLVPVVITAVVVHAAAGGREFRGQVRRFVPTFAALTGLAVAWSLWQLRHGGPATQLLGAYRAAGETSYDASGIVRFVLYHAADAVLLAGVAPACATALFCAHVLRRRDASDQERAFAAVALSLPPWLVLEVGTFASRHVGRLAERNLLPLAPLAFVGLAAWAARGAPRPRTALAISVLVATGLLVALPAATFVSPAALPDALTLVPFVDLRDALPAVNLDTLVVDLALPLLAAVALLPRRLLWVLPVSLLVALGAASFAAAHEVASESLQLRRLVLPADRGWIDRAADANVTWIYGGEPRWNTVYENVFWNRRIGAIYDLPGAVLPGPAPQTPVGPERDGGLTLADGSRPRAADVVASTSVTFFGRALASAPSLVLWRAAQPPRLSSWLTGMDVFTYEANDRGGFVASGDLGSRLFLTIYGCVSGRLRLTAIAPDPKWLIVQRGGRVVARIRLAKWESQTRSFALRSPAHATHDERAGAGVSRACGFRIDSPGALVHIPRLELDRGA